MFWSHGFSPGTCWLTLTRGGEVLYLCVLEEGKCSRPGCCMRVCTHTTEIAEELWWYLSKSVLLLNSKVKIFFGSELSHFLHFESFALLLVQTSFWSLLLALPFLRAKVSQAPHETMCWAGLWRTLKIFATLEACIMFVMPTPRSLRPSLSSALPSCSFSSAFFLLGLTFFKIFCTQRTQSWAEQKFVLQKVSP